MSLLTVGSVRRLRTVGRTMTSPSQGSTRSWRWVRSGHWTLLGHCLRTSPAAPISWSPSITVFQNQVPNSKGRVVIHLEELPPEQRNNYCPSNEPLPPESQTNYRPRVGVHTPGAGHCRTGVGAMSRCPRFENASMYHILHAVSEEPVRISRSCLDGSKGSCGPATTLHALPPRSARLTAACELIERLARVQDLLLSYAGRFLPSG